MRSHFEDVTLAKPVTKPLLKSHPKKFYPLFFATGCIAYMPNIFIPSKQRQLTALLPKCQYMSRSFCMVMSHFHIGKCILYKLSVKHVMASCICNQDVVVVIYVVSNATVKFKKKLGIGCIIHGHL